MEVLGACGIFRSIFLGLGGLGRSCVFLGGQWTVNISLLQSLSYMICGFGNVTVPLRFETDLIDSNFFKLCTTLTSAHKSAWIDYHDRCIFC